jgi:pimeloyl-ACP methyl ester carboxylesterase
VRETGRFLDVAGERIHVVEAGSGTPLLLVHGFPSNSTAFALLMPRLAARHAMVAVDMVGFGLSTRRPRRPLDGATYADRLVGLLDTLGPGWERPDVVGLSWGGSVAQRLAARHPQRVRRLALLASVSAAKMLPLSTANLVGLALAVRVPSVGRLAVRRFLGRMPDITQVEIDDLVRGYTDPLRRPGTLAALRRFVRDTAATPPIDLRGISAPTLVVVPEADRVVPPADGYEIAANIPGARLERLPGVGHALQFEAAGQVSALLLDFFDA